MTRNVKLSRSPTQQLQKCELSDLGAVSSAGSKKRKRLQEPNRLQDASMHTWCNCLWRQTPTHKPPPPQPTIHKYRKTLTSLSDTNRGAKIGTIDTPTNPKIQFEGKEPKMSFKQLQIGFQNVSNASSSPKGVVWQGAYHHPRVTRFRFAVFELSELMFGIQNIEHNTATEAIMEQNASELIDGSAEMQEITAVSSKPKRLRKWPEMNMFGMS
jgi:hypothetical protein